MKVRSEAVIQGRSVAVELDEQDAQMEFGEHWDSWSLPQRFKMLSAKADLMVVMYLYTNQQISSEMAKDRADKLNRILVSE